MYNYSKRKKIHIIAMCIKHDHDLEIQMEVQKN